ncbi:MAG: DUF1667 domain-containing protein [Bacilli bacterium]|nr:DUF1667 domain-containing protein [Bacilli bacterium]
MKEMICIVCPRGCHLKVNDNNEVSGNFCPRGAKYAIEEITCPKRYITSTVRTVNLKENLVPVKTSQSVDKKIIFQVMEEIKKAVVDKPIKIGDVIIKNVLNSGADVIATKNVD